MGKVLVVVDMQNDFIDGSLGTPEAVKIVENVADKVRNWDGTVLVTQDSHKEDYLKTNEGRNLPVKHCILGTPGWQLCEALEKVIHTTTDNPGKVFVKYTFASIDLAEELVELDKKEPLNEVVLIGLCTDICVISNALIIKAFLPEVQITVDADCCAGVTPQSHINALNAMKMCQINIQSADISGCSGTL